MSQLRSPGTSLTATAGRSLECEGILAGAKSLLGSGAMVLTGFRWLERHAEVELLWLVGPLSGSPSAVSVFQAEPGLNHR